LDNKAITQRLKLTVQLMELHDENPFKIRSYQSAINTIDRIGLDLKKMDVEKLQEIKGIGKNIAEAIAAIAKTNSHPLLDDLMRRTPEGLLEVLQLKGLGPKKIKVLWKELEVTSLHQLREACQSGKVALLKGFGERTQQAIMQAMEFAAANTGKWLYAEVEASAAALLSELEQKFAPGKASIIGEFARNIEIIEQLEYLVETPDGKADFGPVNRIEALSQDLKISSPFKWRGRFGGLDLKVIIHFARPDQYIREKLLRTAGKAHLLATVQEDQSLAVFFKTGSFTSEAQAYEAAGLNYVPPELREGQFEIPLAREGKLPRLLEFGDLKGPLHNHSTYSDGKHNLREMAEYCISLGYEYLGMADHSQSAIYAGGLDIDKVMQQQEEIRKLNSELAPFRIFAGIESDILGDGSLDYPEHVLETFDFVVASVHSSLGMDRQKATARLLNAIKNPFTTILGHPTARLLLRRDGYPLDHQTVIDACADHQVVIEINANPRRLDLDWRWVHYALEKGVTLSINPDAHEKGAFRHMKYGVLVGRKGGLTKEKTLNALSREELEVYFAERKKRRGERQL